MTGTADPSEGRSLDHVAPADVTRLKRSLTEAEGARGSAAVDVHGSGLGARVTYPEASRALFVEELDRPIWSRAEYHPARAADDLQDPQVVAEADVEQLARMLTAAQRGERFCDGWWLRVLDARWLWPVVDRLEQLVAGDGTASDGPAGANDDA